MSLTLSTRKIITRLVNYAVKVYVDSTDQSEIQVVALHPGLSAAVDTELPDAALLADGEDLPVTPTIGAVMKGLNSAGKTDIARLTKTHDVDTGSGEELAVGVSLRKPGSGASTDWMDDVDSRLATISSSLSSINSNIDGLEGYVDGLEALVTTLNGYVDGLEALAAAPIPAGTNLIGKTQEKGVSGSSVNGTRDLTAANTWYAVPSTVPANDYMLVVTRESVAGTLRWGFSNSSTPSATNGNLFTSESLVLRMGANQSIYVGSTTAGDDVNWTTKEI